jgi:hypothetical protein
MTECPHPTPPNHHRAFPSRGFGMKTTSKSLQGRNPRDVGRSAPAGAYQVEDGHVNAPVHAALTIDHQTAIDRQTRIES